MSSPASSWSESTELIASTNCSRYATSAIPLAKGRAKRFPVYHDGRGQEPVTVVGRTRSLVAVSTVAPLSQRDCSAYRGWWDPAVALAPDDNPDRVGRLVADRPEPVRRGRVERDRVSGAELVALEADLHSEPAGGHVPVLLASVPHEGVLRARLAPDVVRDLQELDPGVGGC